MSTKIHQNENTGAPLSLGSARVGVDIGRVIMAPTDASGRADTSFLSGGDDAALGTPPSEGAFDVLRELVLRTNGNVWLVSKCGPRIQKLTLRWLRRWEFHEATGVRGDRVRFCLERRDKATHAAELHLSHFIDDRQDVLEHLRGVVPMLYLFGHQSRGTALPVWARHMPSWADVRRELLDGPAAQTSLGNTT